ncbi:MAG: YfiR family protein, partial [Steroidobacteraceae bacterium]
GATINFVPLDRRVRFEISLVAATRAKLRIGADLLSVAARVRSAQLGSEAGCIPARTREQPVSMCSRRVASL